MDAIVVIAASSGGLGPLICIVAALPAPSLASIFITSHIGAHQSRLPIVLSRAGKLPAEHAVDGALIQPGHIYVAPPDHDMMLEIGRLRLSHGPKVNHSPAADPLFQSAAELYGGRVIGIVLSGGGDDGAAELRTIKAHGGTALVQNPDDPAFPSMPLTALAADHADACLSVCEIARLVGSICANQSDLARLDGDPQPPPRR